MNLLLGRDQKSAALFSLIPLRIGSGVIFHLHAELELDPEEDALIKKYRFSVDFKPRSGGVSFWH